MDGLGALDDVSPTPPPALHRTLAFPTPKSAPPAFDTPDEEVRLEHEARAALVIESRARAHHERAIFHKRRSAAVLIEKHARGHATRRMPRGRRPSRPVRVVIIGSDWSGATEQAARLSAALSLPHVPLGKPLPSQASWVLHSTCSIESLVSLKSLRRPPTHWVLCTAEDDALEARGLAATASQTKKPTARKELFSSGDRDRIAPPTEEAE